MPTAVLAVIVAALSFTAHAESPVTYVGDGRWACAGNGAVCAQVDSNNHQQGRQRASNYLRDQERAKANVDGERCTADEPRKDQRFTP